jgi:hypothetical protein
MKSWNLDSIFSSATSDVKFARLKILFGSPFPVNVTATNSKLCRPTKAWHQVLLAHVSKANRHVDFECTIIKIVYCILKFYFPWKCYAICKCWQWCFYPREWFSLLPKGFGKLNGPDHRFFESTAEVPKIWEWCNHLPCQPMIEAQLLGNGGKIEPYTIIIMAGIAE